MFDHAQSPRLGQKVSTDNTAIRMFSGQELPESPWHGMMIYRTDTQELQVFDAEQDGWIDVVGGQLGQLTLVGPDVPVSKNIGDQWFNTSTTPRQLYIAMSVGADAIAEGEWVSVSDLSAIEQRLDEVEQVADQALTAPITIPSDTEPTGTVERPLQEGDIWIDTNDQNRQYRYVNGQWTTLSVFVSDFTITASKFATTTHVLY